jgi:hypothetical protein
MRFQAFERAMTKAVFTYREAALVAHPDQPEGLRLNLHRWVKKGDLMLSALYPPAYVSLESALHQQGFLPDVPFETTGVTPRATRIFQTPLGRFRFHRIQKKLFFGYDPVTLFAEPEKAFLDYFYFHHGRVQDVPSYWQESRFQNLKRLDWKKGGRMARAYPIPVQTLWKGLQHYAKTHRTA